MGPRRTSGRKASRLGTLERRYDFHLGEAIRAALEGSHDKAATHSSTALSISRELYADGADPARHQPELAAALCTHARLRRHPVARRRPADGVGRALRRAGGGRSRGLRGAAGSTCSPGSRSRRTRRATPGTRSACFAKSSACTSKAPAADHGGTRHRAGQGALPPGPLPAEDRCIRPTASPRSTRASSSPPTCSTGSRVPAHGPRLARPRPPGTSSSPRRTGRPRRSAP